MRYVRMKGNPKKKKKLWFHVTKILVFLRKKFCSGGLINQYLSLIFPGIKKKKKNSIAEINAKTKRFENQLFINDHFPLRDDPESLQEPDDLPQIQWLRYLLFSSNFPTVFRRLLITRGGAAGNPKENFSPSVPHSRKTTSPFCRPFVGLFFSSKFSKFIQKKKKRFYDGIGQKQNFTADDILDGQN